VTFILGGPSSGKSTQAAKLVEEFGYKHLSVRALINDEIAKGTKMGKSMEQTVAQKELVDFKDVNQLVI